MLSLKDKGVVITGCDTGIKELSLYIVQIFVN